MQAFFENQFLQNASEVEHLLTYLIKKDLHSDFLIERLVSFNLNQHHIWNARIKNETPDVDEYSEMPKSHWIRLNKNNHQETFEIIKHGQWKESFFVSRIDEKSYTADSLQHILKQSVYTHGRIEQRTIELNHPYPSTNFVKTIVW